MLKKSSRLSNKKLRQSMRKRKQSMRKRKQSMRKRKQSMKKQSMRKQSNMKKIGGGIIPSPVSQFGYSILGTGQSIVDGWNGKSSSFAYVNPSPETQKPVDGTYYKGNHGIV